MTRPEQEDIEVTSEQIRRVAYECLKERKETGNNDVIVGVTPELLLAIADKLEDYELANDTADSAIFDDQFSIDDEIPIN